MKTMTVELFVVPNAAWCFNGAANGPCGFRADDYHVGLYSENVAAARKVGIGRYCDRSPIDGTNLGDLWIQVWGVSEYSENCGSHGWGIHSPMGEAGHRRMPEYLPAKFCELFKKDGDEVVTLVQYDGRGHKLDEDIEIHWVAAQGKYRYRGWGDFSEAVRDVEDKCLAYTNPKVKEAWDAYMNALLETRD